MGDPYPRGYGYVYEGKSIPTSVYGWSDRVIFLSWVWVRGSNTRWVFTHCHLVGVSRPGSPWADEWNVAACPNPDGSARGRARRGEERQPETGMRGGYKRPRGRGSERPHASACPVLFPARPTLCKRALVLPFIGVRRGSRCTMGGVAECYVSSGGELAP
jgi:hypothetical protein